jgi:hypothetical protein
MIEPIKVTIDTKDLEKKVGRMIRALERLKAAFQDVEEEKTWVKFNLNDYVKIKLTDTGLLIYRERYQNINMIAPELETDSEGFITMQAWKAFQIWGGKHLMMGRNNPFGLEIQFEVKN